MDEHDEYFEYLKTRRRLGTIYRRYLLYPKLARRLKGRSLDVGCGIGDMLAYHRNITGVDINPRTVGFCQARGLVAILMKPDELPFGDRAFNSVLMDNVLEHVLEPDRLLAEVRRVLTPGGHALVGVPGIRGWACDADHKVFYDEASLGIRMRTAGFEPVEVFFMPFGRSDWLNRHLRQYCLYGLFARV